MGLAALSTSSPLPGLLYLNIGRDLCSYLDVDTSTYVTGAIPSTITALTTLV